MSDFPQIPGYRIDRELGRGGMARVYLAVDEKLERHVALKVLLRSLTEEEDITRRFIKEAKTAGKLRHSHIVAIHDVGKIEDVYYFSMEYLEENLRQRVKRGALGTAEAFSIVRQVAGALDYAHGEGLIHRDIKPENIMFRRDGSAVLADFGIAKAVGSGTKLTATGMSIGTPHYMSPEQIRGFELDGRADIYSLGVVLFEMLTGFVPYEAADTIAIAMKHVQEPVPALPSRLARYQPLVERMMAKDREDRVQSGSELVRLVEELESADLRRAGAPGVASRAGVRDMDGGTIKERERFGRVGAGGAHGARKPTPVRVTGAGAEDSLREKEAPEGIYPYESEERETRVSSPNRTRNTLIGVLGGALVVTVGILIGILSREGRDVVVKPSRSLSEGGAVSDRSAKPSTIKPSARGVKSSYEEESRRAVPTAGRTWRESLTGMEFVWIPGGEFQIGSTSSEADNDEQPVHRVSVDGFWMGKCEVTQGQWRAVMGTNPSYFQKGDNYPVESVSWEDAQEFIRKLNSRSGGTLRLPSEAEWEYACRAGTTQDRYGNLDDIAWYDNNSGGSTHPVGQKRPNVYGLYDMLGNVWEWCKDWHGTYSSGYVRNPTGPSSGSYRVLRGGSWYNGARSVRAAVRDDGTPSRRAINLGFRLARTQ